jgi:hypothetical protein
MLYIYVIQDIPFYWKYLEITEIKRNIQEFWDFEKDIKC